MQKVIFTGGTEFVTPAGFNIIFKILPQYLLETIWDISKLIVLFLNK